MHMKIRQPLGMLQRYNSYSITKIREAIKTAGLCYFGKT